MSDDKDDLRSLASAISLALTAMSGGKEREFILVVVDKQSDGLTLNNVGNVLEPLTVRMIGKHLIDMATAQKEPSLDPFDDYDIRGHA